jgi:glycosyltransferase involved in cell wall biosynthesis
MKDDFVIEPSLRNRVVVFNKINKETVRLVINSCIAAICTSYEETQHLSGVECAACNVPIIAREVGVYYDNKDDPRWGHIADDNTFVEKIYNVLQNKGMFYPRECFIEKYSTDICKENWRKIIDEI